LLPVALALAVVSIGSVILGSGILGGTPSASPTSAVAPTLPAAPSALPTVAEARAAVTSVTLAGSRYEVAFTTTGFEPSMAGRHVHFFWNTVDPAQAGEPGDGAYVVYAGQSPFAEFAPSGRPEGATAICIVVASVDHSVVAGSGSCAPLP
jgi:hypothetical protein